MKSKKQLFESRTLPDGLFPELVDKYQKEPQTLLNYYKQNHELYMYGLFYKTQLKNISKATIDGVSGYYVGAVAIKSQESNTPIQLETPPQAFLERGVFHGMLSYAPVPFIFVASKSLNFKGGKEIRAAGGDRTGNHSISADFTHGMILDSSFSGFLGVDFIAGDLLQIKDVEHYYIGFLYNKTRI